MSRKDKKKNNNAPGTPPAYSVPRVSFKLMNNNGPVPVAKPADFIQLTPIVQPMSIVPYSTQSQPLAQFEDDDE